MVDLCVPGEGVVHINVHKGLIDINVHETGSSSGEEKSGQKSKKTDNLSELSKFLLELLSDQQNQNIIKWQGNDDEFELKNPDMVAQLWGERT